MATRFVTGVDTDGEVLAQDDSLTIVTGGAITVSAAGVSGIFSTGLFAKVAVLGDVVTDGDGIHLEGVRSTVFVGQSGTIISNRFGVSLGSVAVGEVSLRNEGAITGYQGGVKLEGAYVDFANTGTISIPLRRLADNAAAVTVVSVGFSYITNTGSIIAGIHSELQKAISGSSGLDFITNSGLIRGHIDLGAGDDSYYGQDGSCEFGTISLGTGANVAYGGLGEENFELAQDGDRRDDFIDGGSGIDFLYIHDGTESIRLDLRTIDRQNTGVGHRTVRNVENLCTGNGNDRVTGSVDDNWIQSQEGDDTLDAGLGDDTLSGGADDDTAVFSGSVGATVDLSKQGQVQNTGYGFDTLYDIENLTGGSGDDRFTGDGAANKLLGGVGNDTLQGGGGGDTLDGGSGVNTAVFSGQRAQATITRNSDGSLTVAGPDGTDRLYNIRLLQFGDRLEVINTAPTGLSLSAQSVGENAPLNAVVATLSAADADGDALRYSLAAGSPFTLVDNSLVVASAIDFEAARQHSVTVQAWDDYGGVTSQTFTITVNNAVDTTPFVLRGGSGVDVLLGEAGNDTLYGGLGNDVLTGGAGKDMFVFDTRTNKRTNVDRIADFNARDDSIYLDNKVFTKLGSGAASKPKMFASDMFVQNNKAQDAEDRIIYDKNSGKLYYDQDGTGSKAQVQIATLTNKALLKYSDFFVI